MKNLKLLAIVSLLGLLPSLNSSAQTAFKSVNVQIGNLIVADRNVGAKEDGIAYNYTNNEKHTDHKNSAFKGDYYSWYEAQNACDNGWRLPTHNELKFINSKIFFFAETAYLSGGNGKKCYFPLSGVEPYPSSVTGNYWSSTALGNNKYVFLNLTSNESNIYTQDRSRSMSVRCVKTAGDDRSQGGEVMELTEEAFFKKVANSENYPESWNYLGDKPAIVHFYADWCAPCRRVVPILKELTEEYADEIYVYRVSTDDEKKLALKFGISSIPALMYIPLGKNPKIVLGLRSKEYYGEMIDEFLLAK